MPISKGPRSFPTPDWDELDAVRKVVLGDVSPGTYRLRVLDWQGWTTWLDSGPLFDQEVAVPAGGRGEVRISLGAGCITGNVPTAKASFGRSVDVFAIAKASGTLPRKAHCDLDGNFCLRYLQPGVYLLFIHDPKVGFCKVDDVEVAAGVVDVGERVFQPGRRSAG